MKQQEDDKIKDHVVRESKNTCIFREKQFFLIHTQNMSSARPTPKKYIKPTIYSSIPSSLLIDSLPVFHIMPLETIRKHLVF